MRPHATDYAMIKRRGMPRSAGALYQPWRNTGTPMSELAGQIDCYLADLARVNASPHSIRAYAADLRQFLEYLSPPDLEPPAPSAIDVVILREWLAALYRNGHNFTTIRRKLAAVRGLFRFLLREGVIRVNVARLVRTPKAPKTLPYIMTEEQVNTLIDHIPSDKAERPYPTRDRAIFELLYGCG